MCIRHRPNLFFRRLVVRALALRMSIMREVYFEDAEVDKIQYFFKPTFRIFQQITEVNTR